ncbi:MAG: M20 family metallopeptidase [Treponema sp.]
MKTNNNYRSTLIDFVSRAVKIPSINPPGKEEAMLKYLEDFLSAHTIDYSIVPVAAHRFNILARLQGMQSTGGIVFTGHTDVVPVSDEERIHWKYDPFSAHIENGILYGRGSSDMKGGLCAALYAMASLKEENITPARDVIFAATVDEENLMAGSKALVNSPLLDGFSFLVVCEPTDMHLCLKGKGRTWANLCVKGKTGHGSQIGVGENAIYTAMKLIEKMQHTSFASYSSPENGESFWRTLAIHAGVEPQIVPDTCILTVDARLAAGHPCEQVWQHLDNIIQEMEQETENCRINYTVIDKRPSWVTKENHPFAQHCIQTLNKCGIPYIPDIFSGSTDGNILAARGLTPVIIGPGDLRVVHRENEYVQVDQLYQAFEFYRQLMINQF